MSEGRAIGSSSALAPPVAPPSDRPYPPSWLHLLVSLVERLPGPTWIAYAAFAVAAALFWHAQAWSNGQAPWGTFDPTSLYWGLLGPAVLWCAAFMERVATSAFETFRPALTLSPEGTQRLRYELVVDPARPALVVVLVAAAVSAADIAFGNNANYAGLSPPMLVLAFLVQTLYVSITFVILYRMVRQMRLVRRTLASSVAIDIFRPGPLNAFAMLTSRPAAVLTLIVASSNLVVPPPSDLGASIVGWAPYVVVPSIVAAIAFIVPLTGVHDVLVDQKERLQDAANARLEGLLADLNQDVDARDLARADGLNKTLASLMVQRDVLAKLPTWPWSGATLRAFLSAIMLPLVLFIAQQLISRAL
jgi:hypothetical protein